MKHSPQIRLANARAALRLARMDCAHWDLDDEPDPQGRECCYALHDAIAALRLARRAAEACD